MINSLILSAELFWNVFSWSIPSKAILNQELLMSMAVHRRITLHRRHWKRVLHFQTCYLFSFVPLHVFWGAGGEGGGGSQKKTHGIWELLPTPGPSSTLAIRKMSLFSVQILYTQDPLNALTLSLLLKILHSEWNFCFEPYLLDLMYFCLWGGNSLWWQGLNYAG